MKVSSALTEVALVDSQQAVRELLAIYLEHELHLQIAGNATTGQEALVQIAEQHPNLLISDIVLPDLSILDFLRRVHACSGQTRTIAFCRWINEEAALNLVAAGVRGIVLKDQSLGHLRSAVKTALGGACYFPTSMENSLQRRQVSRTLTERESLVLRLVAEGYPSKLIADKMKISIRTAEKYRQRIMAKLRLHDVVSLTRYAIRNGFATL